MRFIADEYIEKPIIKFLRLQGHNVVDIKEVRPGIHDEEVINIAIETSEY